MSQKEINIKDFRRNSSDTGSSEVQIAQLTQRISELTGHFKKHKKDFHSQLGLVKLISQRKQLLSYLKGVKFDIYQKVVHQLGLRK